jgi:type III restriction enzyme
MQPMAAEQVRREFPIVSYAQKQLSCVGTLPEEINRLVTDPVKEKLAEINDKIKNNILPQIRQQRMRELRLGTLSRQLMELSVTIKSKKEQVRALQSQLPSLAPPQQVVIAAHDLLSQQDQALNRVLELPQKASDLLAQTRRQVAALGNIAIQKELPASDDLQKVADDANNFLKKTIDGLGKLVSESTNGEWMSAESQRVVEGLRKLFADHQAEYDKCVQASARNAKQLEEIQGLNKQVSGLEAKFAEAESERNTLLVVFDEIGNTHWDAFLTALQERAVLLKSQCDEIAAQAQHEFKPEFAFCGNKTLVADAVEKLIQGKNVKDGEQKVKALSDAVCCADHPVVRWSEVMLEIEALYNARESDVLPETPILKNANFSAANLESIKKSAKPELLEEIRYLPIDDQIKFLFRLGVRADGTDNYIAFDNASPGQQATCLLRTLLAQQGAPLLIDQPEEDLDNEQIHVLAGRIAETKHNRQLIFVSHNANIVVNGDAELVICFRYRNEADNTQGKIDPLGSIDCAPVRESITKVMEGGRSAFELRKTKYGF